MIPGAVLGGRIDEYDDVVLFEVTIFDFLTVALPRYPTEFSESRKTTEF